MKDIFGNTLPSYSSSKFMVSITNCGQFSALSRCLLDASDRLCSENCHSCQNQPFQGSMSFPTSISTDSVAANQCSLLFYDGISGNEQRTTFFELFPSGIVAYNVPSSFVTAQFNQGSSIIIKFVDAGSKIISSYFGANVSMTIENCGSAVFTSCGNSVQTSAKTCVQLSGPFWPEENIGIADAVQAAAMFMNYSIAADAKIDGSCILKFAASSIIFPNHFISTNSSILLYASSLQSSIISLVTTGVPISFQLDWGDGGQKLNSLSSSRALILLSYCGNASLHCGSSSQFSGTSCLTTSSSGSSIITGFIIRGDATLNCRLTFTVLEYQQQVFTHQDFEVRASRLTVDSFPSIVRVGYPYSFITSVRDDNFVRLHSLFGVTMKFKLDSCGSGSFDSCGNNSQSQLTKVQFSHLSHRLSHDFCQSKRMRVFVTRRILHFS